MKPMHGSVSLIRIDKLATEYLIRFRNGGSQPGTEDYVLCRQDYEHMLRRVGYENTLELIRKASETYDLLVPKDSA